MKTREFSDILINSGFSMEWSVSMSEEYYIFYGHALCGIVNRHRLGDYMIGGTRYIPNMKLAKVLHNAVFEYSFTPISKRDDIEFKAVLVNNED